MDFDVNWVTNSLLTLIPLWISLSVHEWAHAWSAYRLGDDTAAMMGRMTINPLAHIDPIGTILLPLLGIPFGWAKPVPVQPHRFRRDINMRTGMMITAIAGPISNLCLAAASMLLLAIVLRFKPDFLDSGLVAGIVLFKMIFLNVVLAVFNLLPIPPLDGSRVADGLMPRALRPAWENLCRLGPFALMAVILLPQVAHINLFYWPLKVTMYLLAKLLTLLGG
jgi:Zn-dependent protease